MSSTTRGKLYLEAKKELAIQKEADPKGKKAKTLKGKAAVEELREAKRYAVMKGQDGSLEQETHPC